MTGTHVFFKLGLVNIVTGQDFERKSRVCKVARCSE